MMGVYIHEQRKFSEIKVTDITNGVVQDINNDKNTLCNCVPDLQEIIHQLPKLVPPDLKKIVH